jgi:antitoxin (DNA-binding transcriptional repressor) of toxin-antitoxin stability system
MAKRYATVAELRAHLADALDHAERGDTVEVERRGQRFLLVAAPAVRRGTPACAWVEVLDPTLLETGWTWDYDGGSMKLRVGKKPAPPPRPSPGRRR